MSQLKNNLNSNETTLEFKFDIPNQEVIKKHPALKLALDEKEEAEKRANDFSGERDVCSDLEWGDYSAKS